MLFYDIFVKVACFYDYVVVCLIDASELTNDNLVVLQSLRTCHLIFKLFQKCLSIRFSSKHRIGRQSIRDRQRSGRCDGCCRHVALDAHRASISLAYARARVGRDGASFQAVRARRRRARHCRARQRVSARRSARRPDRRQARGEDRRAME